MKNTPNEQDNYNKDKTPAGIDEQAEHYIQPEQAEQAARRLTERAEKRLQALNAALDPDSPEYNAELARIFDELAELWPRISESAQADMQQAADLVNELDRLEPFINAELSKGNYQLRTFADILGHTAGELLDMARDPASEFAQILEAARDAQKKRDKLSQIGVPKRYQVNQTLLNKYILTGTKDFGNIINTGNKHNIATYKQGRKQYFVTAKANSKNIKIYGETGEYDAAVANSVTTLINAAAEAGELPIFTEDQIARCMAGKVDVQEISKQTKKEVRDSLYRCNDIKVDIDATAEITARGAELNGEKIKSFFVRNNPYFDFREIEVETSNGSVATAYWFKETPITSTYAELTNGLQWVPAALNDIKEKTTTQNEIKWTPVPSNKYRVCIVNYLHRRVYQANQAFADYKKECRQRNKAGKRTPERPTDLIITFASVFEAAGITSKNTVTNAKGYVKTVMEYWENMGYIKGFSVRKKGKAEDAIILEYED